MTVLPHWFYSRSPEYAADTLEQHNKIQQCIELGCQGCKHNRIMWNIDVCELGKLMPRSGVCRGFEVKK